MLTATLLLLGAVLLGMCLLELHVTRLPLSPAVVYLGVGWIAGAMVRARVQTPPAAPARADMLVVITEIAVLISLFAVGLQLRMPWPGSGLLNSGKLTACAPAAIHNNGSSIKASMRRSRFVGMSVPPRSGHSR